MPSHLNFRCEIQRSVARTEPKVNVPKPVTHLNWAPICEWCVVRCGSTNRHHQDMSLQEIGRKCSDFVNHSWLNSQNN